MGFRESQLVIDPPGGTPTGIIPTFREMPPAPNPIRTQTYESIIEAQREDLLEVSFPQVYNLLEDTDTYSAKDRMKNFVKIPGGEDVKEVNCWCS